MKKLLAVSLVLNVALVTGWCWKELTANAAGGGGVPVGNGDINGDGFINITDVIALLGWMYQGGNAPEAIECPPPGGGALPATGQTKCYDTGGAEIDCTSTDCPGQDGFYKAGCATAGRFTDNGDGTVTDTCTGLMWQKETAPGTYTWQEALLYCEGLSLGDHTDWRLPNVRELQSIVDYGRTFPAIDTTVFGAFSDWYWSSTSYVGSLVGAWGVNFYVGGVYGDVYGGEDGRYFVRAVRTGP